MFPRLGQSEANVCGGLDMIDVEQYSRWQNCEWIDDPSSPITVFAFTSMSVIRTPGATESRSADTTPEEFRRSRRLFFPARTEDRRMGGCS